MDSNSRTLTATCCFLFVLVREGAWEEKALATYAQIPGGGEAIDGGHMVALSNPAALAERLVAYRLEVQEDHH